MNTSRFVFSCAVCLAAVRGFSAFSSAAQCGAPASETPPEVPAGFGSNGVFTVGCWLKIDDPPGYYDVYTLLYRGSSCGFSRVQFHLSLTDRRPMIRYSSPFGNQLGIRKAGSDWLANDGRRIPASQLPKVGNGAWHHVAAVSGTNDTLALYVDGALWFSARRCGTRPPQVADPVRVGIGENESGIPHGRFPGLIDRVLLEPRALTPEELAARIARERPLLDPHAKRAIGRRPETLATPLPRTARYEAHLPAPLPAVSNRVFKVGTIAGRPRITVDGVPVSGLAMMPSPYVTPEEDAKSIRDFAAAGVRFYSDIFWSYGARNDWWLGEGKYDFAKLDAKVAAALAAAPEGFYFPRVKLDPPDWWKREHPAEMRPEHVRPDSAAWAALWPRMLADVVDHCESSPYAGRIMGYQFGALVGSEWITRPEPTPALAGTYRRGDMAPPRAVTQPVDAWRKARGEVITRMVKRAARIVKERTRGNKLTGVFFGYGIPEHAGFHELLRSPDIDYFCSPTTYQGRFAGEPGRFTDNYQASCILNGKLYWDESDLRTHLYHKPSDWRHRDAFESVNAIRRAFGWSWAHGHETWWFCLEGNGLFHAADMMDTIACGAAECAAEIAKPGMSFADVAIFSDPQYATRNEPLHLLVRCRFPRWTLPKTGIAWDMYHIADVTNPALPPYRLYVFLGTDALTAAQREAIRRVCRQKGSTALFIGAPGYYGETREGVACMADVTGIPFAEHAFKKTEAAPIVLADGRDLPPLFLPRVFTPVADSGTRIFGRYRGWGVCAERERDGARAVYMPAPPDEAAFRDICRRAGVHVWLDSNDTLGAGRGYVMVHAATDGQKTVRFPGRFDVRDIFGGSSYEGVTSLTDYLRAGETRVWRLEPRACRGCFGIANRAGVCYNRAHENKRIRAGLAGGADGDAGAGR